MENRLKTIMKTSIIGIIANVFLASFKVVVGLLSNSIAVILDGVNNFADAGSSVITILGAALAGKQPDRKHPFGHGRVEYLSALIVSGLVLYAGITALIESITSIIHPEAADYSYLTLTIISVAIVIKIVLGLYTKSVGTKVNSDSLIASGKDALMDVILSAGTLVAAIVFMVCKVQIEAYIGAIISLVIIKSGIELLRETISKLIGEPGEVSLAIDVKKTIASFDEVHGAFDLVMNDYGPETNIASVHVEVDDTYSVAEMDTLSRKIFDKVLEEHNVVLSAIGFYSRNTQNEEAVELEKAMRSLALEQEYVRGFHGFYVDFEKKETRFDLVISLDSKDRVATFTEVLEILKKAFPEYEIKSSMDIDLNEAEHIN